MPAVFNLPGLNSLYLLLTKFNSIQDSRKNSLRFQSDKEHFKGFEPTSTHVVLPRHKKIFKF